MGFVSWIRRRRLARQAARCPVTDRPAEAKGEPTEPPKPLRREMDEARAQAHGHSHLTG